MTQIVAGKNALSPKEPSKVRILALAALVIGANVCASIASGSLLAKDQGWKQLDVPNRPAAKFSFEHTGGGKHNLTVRTNKSVAFLYREVTAPEARSVRSVSWRWRLDQVFSHTDLTAKGKDDRPLAIHLWFSDPEQPSVFGPLGWIFGYPHITHTLTYVLGGDHRPGAVFTNPYYDNGAILVLRGAAVSTGHWYTELRDIKRDIEASFPSMPMMKTLKYIAVSADTDDIGGSSLARLANLQLSGRSHGFIQ